MTQAPKLSRLVLDQTSIRPLAASNRTTAPLVSSGAAVARGQRSSRRTTRSAAVDASATYMTLSGAGTHRYMKLGNASGWTTQRDRCAADGANAYLAIPDDMAELDAIRTLAAARSWIGLDDMTTEGTFMTVRGMPATYVPWDTGNGEPNNGTGTPQNCVTALSGSPLIATDRCNDAFVAVCECEP